jgi:predicted NBD/HSP70 family sugar kinase
MLYRGEDDVVSEVGHITINHKGPQCICGNIGCLELYAKITNLIGKAPGKRGDESIQAENERLRHGVSEIFAQANAGEPRARKKLEEYGRLLGIGAVTIANMFSPEYIIVSGNDFGDLDYTIICEEMQRSIHRHAFSVISDKVKVVQSRLGNNIMLYGGVALVLQDFFNNIES